MMRKRQYLLATAMCLSMALLSCGLNSMIEEMGQLSTALDEEFGHTTSVNMQINNNVSSWTITFSMYDANLMDHDLLSVEAERVYEFLLDEFDKAAKQDFIIIRFTSGVLFDEATSDIAEFRYNQ